MNPNIPPDTLDATASILHGEIEIQAVGGRLFLTSEEGPDAGHVSMSMSAAYELLDWLYSRHDIILQMAHREQDATN